MFNTVGVLAHVDAGKTTFSEQLLFHTKTIRERGRVDHQDTFLDSHQIEKSRGITVFADQAQFTYNETTYTLIDTPGHVDFSPEMERSIQVMDYAILLISAADGIQGHTETVWQLLQKNQIPTLFFINKMDREDADAEKLLAEIKTNFTENAIDFSAHFLNGIMDKELIESIAERDDILFERYMNDEYDSEVWLETAIQLIKDKKLFPCFFGSALKDDGVMEFLQAFDKLTTTTYSIEEPFAAQVYKIRHDSQRQRVTFMKALSGKLEVRNDIQYGEMTEKVTQIRSYNGEKFTTVPFIEAGQLFAVTGLSALNIGDYLGTSYDQTNYDLVPTLTSKVQYDPAISAKDMLACFQILDAEDPSLRVEWEEHFQEIHVHVMGIIQLEVLQQLMNDRFAYEITFGTPKILYKETIANAVIGYGHFEPLRHYAEVHLKIEPAPRNQGIQFLNECHANDLSIGNQNLVREHLFERKHHGLLTGSQVTDVTITLLTGRGHNEHTSGGDFREATFRALRQGLEQADNRLLEPYYQFKIKVEQDMIGKVLSDIQQAYGTFEPPETVGDKVIVQGHVPVATFMNYSQVFAAITNGKGALSLQFSGYDICHNVEEVIAHLNYDKDADPLYTSSSIFCAKGKGYTVPWHEAKAAMHCL